MRRILLLALLTFGLLSVPVWGESDNYLYYSKLDVSENAWTNITIDNLEYHVMSDLAFHDGLVGSLLSFDWNTLEQLANDVNFFEMEDKMEDPTINLTLELEGKINTISLDLRIMYLTEGMSNFLGFINHHYSQISGLAFSSPLWPVDAEIGVLESFPPQYVISMLFQRGNDLLTVIVRVNLTLVAGEVTQLGNFSNLEWIKTAPHVQKKTVEIASGGQSQIIKFDTFSFGSIEDPYDYDKFGFAVFVGDKILFQYQSGEGYNFSEPDDDLFSSIPTVSSSLQNIPNLIIPSLLGLATVPLLKRRKE